MATRSGGRALAALVLGAVLIGGFPLGADASTASAAVAPGGPSVP